MSEDQEIVPQVVDGREAFKKIRQSMTLQGLRHINEDGSKSGCLPVLTNDVEIFDELKPVLPDGSTLTLPVLFFLPEFFLVKKLAAAHKTAVQILHDTTGRKIEVFSAWSGRNFEGQLAFPGMMFRLNKKEYSEEHYLYFQKEFMLPVAFVRTWAALNDPPAVEEINGRWLPLYDPQIASNECLYNPFVPMSVDAMKRANEQSLAFSELKAGVSIQGVERLLGIPFPQVLPPPVVPTEHLREVAHGLDMETVPSKLADEQDAIYDQCYLTHVIEEETGAHYFALRRIEGETPAQLEWEDPPYLLSIPAPRFRLCRTLAKDVLLGLAEEILKRPFNSWAEVEALPGIGALMNEMGRRECRARGENEKAELQLQMDSIERVAKRELAGIRNAADGQDARQLAVDVEKAIHDNLAAAVLDEFEAAGRDSEKWGDKEG